MKRLSYFNLAVGGVLALCFVASSALVARADDDDYRDYRWRQHERQEREWRERRERAREEHERHERWDHRYWDRDEYRPPAVVYEPEPPPGAAFMFRFGR